MNVEIRPATAEEMGEMGILGGYVYGGSFGDGPENVIATANLPDWTLCAFVDGKLASMFSDIPFTMRANGNAVKLAGVSTIGTQPEHRRQGLVRQIHTRAFGDMREAGQNVAALWASQAAIYQRYGYAMATVLRRYTVDTVDIRFHDGDEGGGRVARVDLDEAYDVVKGVYIQFIADRMCYLHRAKALWLQNALEPVEADGPIWVAVCYDEENRPQGYVIYTLRAGKVDHAARGQELVVRDLAWLTPDAYRSLWRFIASHDDVGRRLGRRGQTCQPSAQPIARLPRSRSRTILIITQPHQPEYHPVYQQVRWPPVPASNLSHHLHRIFPARYRRDITDPPLIDHMLSHAQLAI